ncbi:hypothetical protein ABEB36_009880 [Hypothenemus hampei]|uniref:Ras-related protein Rab-36 n=1 Tax=Hypothenemus hampei TaxID=57062 RepID=A0ABD1EHS8_HYPHA
MNGKAVSDDDRNINKFPWPYSLESTPYLQTDFREQIKRQCLNQENNLTQGWLKMSKVVIIGDICVGKTSLVNRYCRKFFESNYKSTIGVDFEVENFYILGIPFMLQIWDTAGQERFKSIAQSYYRGANVLIIVFDLTNWESLSNCKKWLFEALDANLDTRPLIFLIGSKSDLLNSITYKPIKANALEIAKEINAEYWAVSSKSGKNISKLFRRIAALSFERVLLNSEETSTHVNIGQRLMDENRDNKLLTKKSFLNYDIQCYFCKEKRKSKKYANGSNTSE